MKVIVGLGNPGKQYQETRHNVGFQVVERFAERFGLTTWRRRFHALAAEGPVAGQRVLLLKPETFMNESGRAVAAAVQWCRVETRDVLIVCDDMNLEVGRLRIRAQGSSGGHNGLASIAEHLSTDGVPRLRIGIGAAPPGDARDYVLARFDESDRTKVDQAIDRAVQAVEVWLTAGLEACQNGFNSSSETPSDPERKEETHA